MEENKQKQLIASWRKVADELWSESIVEQNKNISRMIALRDKCAILNKCANDLEDIIK